jgi:hypothetical protein
MALLGIVHLLETWPLKASYLFLTARNDAMKSDLVAFDAARR